MRVSLLSFRSSNRAGGGGGRSSILAAHRKRAGGGVRLVALVALAVLWTSGPLPAQGNDAQGNDAHGNDAHGNPPKAEGAALAAPEQPGAAASSEDIDGETMFATSCGFCHEQGGRAEGKGPKLSNSKRSDAYLIDRIRKGKPGAMPAFGRVFSDGQIMAILAYIRGLDE
jgi:mono/diheme cytochrome c family protein